jgi:Protein kinase domain
MKISVITNSLTSLTVKQFALTMTTDHQQQPHQQHHQQKQLRFEEDVFGDLILVKEQRDDATEHTLEETEAMFSDSFDTHEDDNDDNNEQVTPQATGLFLCLVSPLIAQFWGFWRPQQEQPQPQQQRLLDSVEVDFSHCLQDDFTAFHMLSPSSSDHSLVVYSSDEDTVIDCLEDQQDYDTYNISDFDRHKILGEGQFGQVLLVSDRHGEKRPYALKVLSKYELINAGEVPSIVREATILSNLEHHPFIVRLYATFQDENLIYMLQEFCQGGELFSVMCDGALPETHAKFYTACVADAVAFLHTKQSIVFRDIKPENIMIDELGYPKLIDFGYAKKMASEADRTFTFCGTPRYLAPEVILNDQGYSFGADHWALGILMYEMLSGENPFWFEGLDEMSLFQSVQNDDYPALPDTVSSEAVEIVAGLLEKDPAKRLGARMSLDEILKRVWLQNIDMDALRLKEIMAPWIPEIKDPLDTYCFDDWDDLQDRITQKYPMLTRAEAALFDSF